MYLFRLPSFLFFFFFFLLSSFLVLFFPSFLRWDAKAATTETVCRNPEPYHVSIHHAGLSSQLPLGVSFVVVVVVAVLVLVASLSWIFWGSP